MQLSASGLPSGATDSFNLNPDTPTANVTFTINAASSTPPGTYTIIITGTSPGSNNVSTSLILQVDSPPQ